MTCQLGIIGGGVMATAILSRLLKEGLYHPQMVLISEPVVERRYELQQQYGVQVTDSNRLAVQAEIVLLSVKPQMFDTVVTGLGNLPHHCLILSILAGVPLRRLETAFPHQSVIRVMPNTPATVGTGMTAITAGKQVTAEQLAMAKRIFQCVGEVVEVPESQMDAVTGLSGSGPAFVALMIEALADGGVLAGLPRAVAQKLAVQTVLGTAKLMQETGLHPAMLKDQVTSPGGTTIAGVAKLEEGAFRSTLIQAVYTAYQRSIELGH